MNKLVDAREKIDQIDQEMVTLFEKRMQVVKEVIAYKIENNLPVLDLKRENEVIIKNAKYLQDQSYFPYYQSWMNAMFESSKKMQAAILSHKE